jgi:hypothetical protein
MGAAIVVGRLPVARKHSREGICLTVETVARWRKGRLMTDQTKSVVSEQHDPVVACCPVRAFGLNSTILRTIIPLITILGCV